MTCCFRIAAYHTSPFKRGNVHLSAAHIYVMVLKALELRNGVSFLNVGSGTGYLSCLVAELVGLDSLSHGIEIHEELVEHSKVCVAKWLSKRTAAGSSEHQVSPISFFHGNCFHLNTADAVANGKYDRIYVGADCPDALKEFFFPLLAIGGILVVPVSETHELLRVRRVSAAVFHSEMVTHCGYGPLQGLTDAHCRVAAAKRTGDGDLQRAHKELRVALSGCSESLKAVMRAGGKPLHLHSSVVDSLTQIATGEIIVCSTNKLFNVDNGCCRCW